MKAAAIAIALLGAAACSSESSPRSERTDNGPEPPERTPIYTVEAQALLGGLDVGDELAGWMVELVDGPRDGKIEIELRKGDETFTAWLVKRGTADKPPPYSTQSVDVFFGYGMPRDPGPAGAEINAVLDKLVERITRAEVDVALPPGM